MIRKYLINLILKLSSLGIKLLPVIIMLMPLLSKSQDTSYRLQEAEGEATTIPLHEVTVGVGYFRSFEDNLYNNTDRIPLGNGFNINFNYRFPINPQFKLGFGFNILAAGTSGSIPSYAQEIMVNSIQAGVNGRWIMKSDKGLLPYIVFGAYYSFGDMVDEFDGTSLNTHSGYSLQGGLGVQYPVSSLIYVYLEFDTYFGRAKWNFLPANDSIDRDFNNGGIAIDIGIAVEFSSFDEF